VQQFIETKQYSSEEITSRTRKIYETILHESEHIDGGNFTRIHPDDAEQLFDLYDGLFFNGGGVGASGGGKGRPMGRANGVRAKRTITSSNYFFSPKSHNLIV